MTDAITLAVTIGMTEKAINMTAMPMTWSEWLIAYFLLGALAVVLLWAKRSSRRNTFANEVSAIINRRLEHEMSPWERFVDKKLIPAAALLFAWLFWPFIVMGRIWMAWRH